VVHPLVLKPALVLIIMAAIASSLGSADQRADQLHGDRATTILAMTVVLHLGENVVSVAIAGIGAVTTITRAEMITMADKATIVVLQPPVVLLPGTKLPLRNHQPTLDILATLAAMVLLLAWAPLLVFPVATLWAPLLDYQAILAPSFSSTRVVQRHHRRLLRLAMLLRLRPVTNRRRPLLVLEHDGRRSVPFVALTAGTI
jgi:hypothetical protein